MLAANQLKDFTNADDGVPTSKKTGSGDSYAPATPGATTRLIFPGPRMQVRTQIVAGPRRYNLKGMFVIDLEYLDDEGQVFASHRTLPVHGYGGDQGDALEAFCEAFDVQWRHLVDVQEDTLTDGGRRRRQAMRDAVETVVEIALIA